MTDREHLAEIERILTRAKKLSRRYKEITGKPLGITGEVAEFEAAKRLGLELADARCPGYDAKRKRNGSEERTQIKGRSYGKGARERGMRIGRIDVEDKRWDTVVLVLLDQDYEVREILEASRTAIKQRLENLPHGSDGQQTHTQKGALTVSIFRSISKKRPRRPCP